MGDDMSARLLLLLGNGYNRNVASNDGALFTFPTAFDNAAWTKTNLLGFGSGSVVDAIKGPNGLQEAELITEDTATGEHRVLRNFTATNGVSYTGTIYAKAGPVGARRLILYLATGANGWLAYVNLTTGALTSVAAGAGVGSATVDLLGQGWRRVRVMFTTTGTTLNYSAGLDNGSTNSYAGDGASGIYIWGGQLRLT